MYLVIYPLISLEMDFLEMQLQNDRAFGLQVHQNNEVLRALWDWEKDDVKFTGFQDYADLVLDIHEDINGKFEYLLEKTTDKNDLTNLRLWKSMKLNN